MTTVTPPPLRHVGVHGVSAAHAGIPALTGVDLDPSPGRLTLLIGANGSGKSTLLSVLAGAHPVTAGRVERAPGTTIGFVAQSSTVPDRLPLNVRETVTMGRWGTGRLLRASDRAIVDECLESLAIADLARRPLAGLSGGQRQRALVAQGLARRADLLLLDEPSAGVDSAAHALIRAAVAAEVA
ncbi:ATP-binding cassette domain-containing protein, partial [Rathayibacter tanaceti]